MNRLLNVLVFLILTRSVDRSAQRPQPLKIEADVSDFYVAEFHSVVKTNPDQFTKVRSVIKDYIENRFEISARRLEMLQQLRLLIQRPNSTDEEILRATSEFDKADADLQANQVKFLTTVAPLLNPHQQARVRIFQQVADRRLLQMINSARNPEGQK
jgi:hypothetical protein